MTDCHRIDPRLGFSRCAQQLPPLAVAPEARPLLIYAGQSADWGDYEGGLLATLIAAAKLETTHWTRPEPHPLPVACCPSPVERYGKTSRVEGSSCRPQVVRVHHDLVFAELDPFCKVAPVKTATTVDHLPIEERRMVSWKLKHASQTGEGVWLARNARLTQ
jgi:hypothetical protein